MISSQWFRTKKEEFKEHGILEQQNSPTYNSLLFVTLSAIPLLFYMYTYSIYYSISFHFIVRISFHFFCAGVCLLPRRCSKSPALPLSLNVRPQCVCVLAPLEGGGGGELKMEILDCFVGLDFGRSIDRTIDRPTSTHIHKYIKEYTSEIYIYVFVFTI